MTLNFPQQRSHPLGWLQFFPPEKFSVEAAMELLERMAADPSLGNVALETRSSTNGLSFLIGVEPAKLDVLHAVVGSLVAGSQVTVFEVERQPVRFAARLEFSRVRQNTPLEVIEAGNRSLTAALLAAGSDESVVIQTVLGSRHKPEALLSGMSAFTASVATGQPAFTRYGADAVLRIGVTARDGERAHELVDGVLAALRLSQPDGRIRLEPEPPEALQRVGWHRHHAALDAAAVAAIVAWPIGEAVAGAMAAHPRRLAPQQPLAVTTRLFGGVAAPGNRQPVGIPASDALMGTWLLGPNGSGKSTTLLHLCLADITAGRGLFVLDPKSDLISAILASMDESRLHDVCLIDPSDIGAIVGVNPLKSSSQDPWLTADSLLAIFRNVWAETWGARSEEVLGAAISTLVRNPGATLLWLPSLLTDDEFRARITSQIDDPLGVGLFWRKYERLSPSQQAQLISPVLSKLQELLIRPSLRAALGQASPRFDLASLFERNAIVLVDVNRGKLGEGVSRLLGSMLVGMLFPLILKRAEVPPSQRGVTSIVIDEVQDFLSWPGDFAAATSQVRGLGGAITVANQYRGQLNDSMLAAFDANLRSKLCWRLDAVDATEMARKAPELTAEDFMSLPVRGHVYASVMNNAAATGWFSATTLPPPEPLRDPDIVRQLSRAKYGRPAAEVERQVLRELRLDEPHLEEAS